ncbi:MAG TPA: CHAT domain-containing protein [Candidatus Angelobacter sp.]
MNLTQEQKAVSEERKGIGSKLGHDLVVFEILDHGMQLVRVVREGEKFQAKRKGWFGWFGSLREYASYAVNNNSNLRFRFAQCFDHMSASHYFDLSFIVRYRASDPAEIVKKLGDDPLRMLREEIKAVLGGAVAQLRWNEIVESKLNNNFSVLAARVTQGANFERLERFAAEVGIELQSVETVLNLTSEDAVPIVAETDFERQERIAKVDQQRKQAEISREHELTFPRQILDKQNVVNEKELNRLRLQGELETSGFRGVRKAIEQIAAETRTPDGLQRGVEIITRTFQAAREAHVESAGQLIGSASLGVPAIGPGSESGHELGIILAEALRLFDLQKEHPVNRQILSGVLHWVAENYRGTEADEKRLNEYRSLIQHAVGEVPGGVDSELYAWLQRLLNQDDLQNRVASVADKYRGQEAEGQPEKYLSLVDGAAAKGLGSESETYVRPLEVLQHETLEGRVVSRYPAAGFYHAADGSEVLIPPTRSISPPPEDCRSEFHFWIDTRRGGIIPLGEWPAIKKPDSTPYPLKLKITVWSEDFEFAENDSQVELQVAGATEHAKFAIEKLPIPPRQAEVFVFLRYDGTLVGAFRVRAAVTAKVEQREDAQSIEYAYLATDWFHFDQAPSSSALTIFITKNQGSLQIFTLKSEGRPWVLLGPTESGLYEENKAIYQETQALARRAEIALQKQEKFKFATEARRLAQLGHTLFGAIFLLGPTGDAGIFADDYLSPLPEGSTLTIAIGHEAQTLNVPWGLLYDRKPPADFFDVPELSGFLGYRFNLIVRPSPSNIGRSQTARPPVRIGAAWLEHPETAPLRLFFEKYKASNQIAVEEICVEEHSLPALAKKQFDLIQFFCHGHTRLPGIFSSAETEKFLDGYAAAGDCSEKRRLLMAIHETSDSLLEVTGGFVTLTSLADTLKRQLPGHPVILLSMCESAQVSASGTGFVPLFLRRGARAVIATEGPTLWSLSREMDTGIIGKLMEGESIGWAFYNTKKELAKTNALALIYTLYGDDAAKIV